MRWIAIASLCLAFGCHWQRDESKVDQRPVVVTEKPAAEKPATEVPSPEKTASDTVWHTDLATAMSEAKRLDRPLLVVSILGDLRKRC